jgi:hypothetical protein
MKGKVDCLVSGDQDCWRVKPILPIAISFPGGILDITGIYLFGGICKNTQSIYVIDLSMYSVLDYDIRLVIETFIGKSLILLSRI